MAVAHIHCLHALACQEDAGGCVVKTRETLESPMPPSIIVAAEALARQHDSCLCMLYTCIRLLLALFLLSLTELMNQSIHPFMHLSICPFSSLLIQGTMQDFYFAGLLARTRFLLGASTCTLA